MNKKFSTLVAGLLLAGSLPVAAQYCPLNGEVPYRTRMVKAAELDATLKDVTKINENYWYQLEVNPASLGITAEPQDKSGLDKYVLTVERDYSTGKLYLTAQKVTDVTLTHSLWQIKTPGREVNGRMYSYVNKETGYELTFDHTNAVQVTSGGDPAEPSTMFTFDKDHNFGWTYEKDGLMDGCNSWWSWYTTEDQATTLDYKRIYSYYHNADSVMYLHAVTDENGHCPEVLYDRVYGPKPKSGNHNRFITEGLGENGLSGNEDGGFAVIAVKDSRANAAHYLMGAANVLEIKPVVAGAKVLNAAEINTMIDADKSYLSFEDHIADYNWWGDAKNGDLKGSSTKFTVCKPGTNEALPLAANPLEGEFVAVESFYKDLARDGEDAYAGYNVLFEAKEPTLVVGNQKQYSYLYVHEHNYEGTETGAYNGLQVVTQPYAYLEACPVAGKDGRFADGKKKVMLKYDNTRKDAPDPLEARYMWKVTYYATNDSVVFEPLNASRMNQDEMHRKVAFENSHLAQKDIKPANYVNTVNAAVAYDGSNETEVEGNSMYNKAAGVPVALYAMNNSLVGDENYLITVGAAANKAAGVNAAEDKWAAEKKSEAGNPAYVTNKENGTYQSEMKLVVRFDNEYTYLQRASIASGVYFINLQTGKYSTAQTENRVNGAYIVADMKGHVVYDVAQDEQNFNHMPATQWVVEQEPCEVIDAEGNVNYNKYPVVSIYNREFGARLVKDGSARWTNTAFKGQLYQTKDGKYYIINHRDYARSILKNNVDHHAQWSLNCADTVAFQKLTDVNTLGYFNESEDVLRENVYQFQNIFDMIGFRFLGVDDLDASIDTLKLLEGPAGTEFELFRAEGWYPVEEKISFINDKGEVEEVSTGTFKFEYTDSIPYGYSSVKAGAPQLYKTMYKLKLKDANLIDNDHKFVAINNQHKYVVALESEIENPVNQLSYAIVTLKENNEVDGHCYALVNAEQYTIVKGASKSDLTGLYPGTVKDEYGYMNPIFYKDVDGEKGYNPKKDVIMVEATGKRQISGKLVIEGTTLDAKLADLCETTSSVFALVNGNRPLYRTLDAEYVNNVKKVVDIRTIDEQGRESLFEDSSSAKAQRWNMNYLGVENKGEGNENGGFYVDFVTKSADSRMPQYLFVVAADSVPAYKWCDDNAKHGINPSCGHTQDYAGYVEGRFLINYNDSIQSALIDKQTNADKYKSDVYTRLGFVEGVHRGDSLYILKNGYTLASIKEASVDASENGKLYIRPDYLAADKEGVVYDIVPLDGKHNNVAFSLRNTGDEENSFMIESNDNQGFSGIGSFTGAWIKILNNVPVLVKYYNDNGNHNTGDSTDSWKNSADWTDMSNYTGEFINQGARFVFSAVEKNASATSTEDMTVNEVSVIASKGAVVVKGAAGKAVVINDILGKTVANVVLASDNETISVPAGIVVVSVEGEDAAKVVVK